MAIKLKLPPPIPPNGAPAAPPAAFQTGETAIYRCKWGAMMVNRHDSAIGRALAVYGEFAESENLLMARFLRPGDVAVDIGANVGSVALCLAKTVGPGGTVHAFEPQRQIFQYLSGNAGLNGYTNLRCINAAVGAENGTIALPPVDYGKPRNFGAVSLATPVGDNGEKAEIRTLDSLDLESCRLIKIDVEGMEPAVLEGAEKTINRLRPVVYTENKKNGNSPKIIRFFQERRYRLYWHFARFFQEDNFNGVSNNVFGNRGDINMLCVPPNMGGKLALPPVSGPDADWRADSEEWKARTK